MIEQTYFVLAVPDFETSIPFYRDALGFQIQEMGDPGWRMYVRDQCRIMAGECRDAIPPAELGDHSYFAYLVVSDIEAEFERVSNYGATITKSLREEPWGMREFGLRTVDGHRLMLAQRLSETTTSQDS